ncbi:MAG: methanogenesis marker 16 metalloprotein [Candidatus Hydrothermarchaeota archaeon]
MKTVSEINRKLKRGEAVVVGADELAEDIREGKNIKASDVDVVTCGTSSLVSGTMAILNFKIEEPGKFRKLSCVWLNSVPAFHGPCPNERMGIVDVAVFATTPGRDSEKYGGAHLIHDIVKGKEIEVYAITEEGNNISATTCIDEMNLSQLVGTRYLVKNYYAFVNPNKTKVRTIFSPVELEGPYKFATFAGCGELNPLQHDSFLETIGIGSKIWINGAIGYVIGRGTRSVKERPNLMISANMKTMSPRFLCGFNTSGGPELVSTLAVPIPVINDLILENCKITDENISLPVLNVNDRSILGETNYGEVWRGVDLEVKWYPDLCVGCVKKCMVEEKCPTSAFSNKKLDRDLCHNCGACTSLCEAFHANLGVLKVNENRVKIGYRLSDRNKAKKAIKILNEMLERGEFIFSESHERISFPD